MTEGLLKSVFGITATIGHEPVIGQPVVICQRSSRGGTRV